jgi:hypothetical protein
MKPVPSENPYRYPGSTDAAALGEWYDNNRLPRNQADLKTLQALSAEVFGATGLAATRRDLGPGEHDGIDLILPAGAVGPVPALIFVHGGRWQLNTSRETAFWARACAQHGVAFVGLNFPPLSQARLLAMIDAVAAAVARVVAQAPALGIDADALALAGHSSGAHLALASVLPIAGRQAPDWVCRLRGLLLRFFQSADPALLRCGQCRLHRGRVLSGSSHEGDLVGFPLGGQRGFQLTHGPLEGCLLPHLLSKLGTQALHGGPGGVGVGGKECGNA